MSEREWSTDQAAVDRTRVLAALLAPVTSTGWSRQTPQQVIDELGLTTVNAHRFAEDLQFVHHLVAVGYANGGGRETQLVKFNEAAIGLAEEFRRAGERRRRAPVCRRALLCWLDDNDDGDRLLELSGMSSDPHSWYYGTQFTPQEIGAAGDNLATRGYVEVLTVEELGAFRAHLTARGRTCVEQHDGIVEEMETVMRGGANVNFHGPYNQYGGNNAIGSPGTSQTSTTRVTVGQSATELLQILQALQLLDAIPVDQQQQADEIDVQLQAALAGQATPAGLWDRIGSFFQGLNARANQNTAITLLVTSALNVAAMRAGLGTPG